MKLAHGLALITSGLAIFVGCSSTSTTSSNTGGNNGGGASGGCCTVNGQSYNCPSSTAFDKCNSANPDPSGCSQTASCSGSSNSSTTSLCCGLNGAYYDCPTSDAVLQCTKGMTSSCTSRSTACN